MKTLLKWIAILVVVIFLLLLILPFALKGKVIDLVKEQANANVRAKVEFADVNLSLIKNFPNLAVGIENLSIVGIDGFAGDTLVGVQNIGLIMDVMSVISGDQIVVKRINLEKPYIAVRVLENGTANYDIAMPSETDKEQETASAEESSPVNLSIEEYSITDGIILYDDATFPMKMVIDDLDHYGKGDFAQDVFTLKTETYVKTFNLDYDGIGYARDLKADLIADLAMDLANMKFEFKENELDVNALVLKFDGFVEMPTEDINMDISFDTETAQLTSIMSLIPAYFAQDLEGVDANGQVVLDGYVKGVYNENSMPGFMAELKVDKGSVKYPDLPKSIENIAIDAKVESPEGNDLDKIAVDVPKFYMEIGKSEATPNILDAELFLRNPMTDPHIKTRVDADINLGSFKDIIPMEEDFEIGGDLAAHFKLHGHLSDVENQRLKEFEASGAASLAEFFYKDSEVDVALPIAKMNFTPQQLNVETVNLIYEEINMEMDGYISNYVAYALQDTTLQGVFNFEADRIHVNRFMTSEDGETVEEATEEGEEDQTAPSDTSSGVVPIPENLDVVLNAAIGEITYDELILSNIKGKITLREAVASLDKLTARGLGGLMGISGSYSTKDLEKPTYNFAYDFQNIEIDQAFQTFNTVQKIAPIAKHAKGKVSSDLQVAGVLDQKMEPIYETMQGRGTLTSDEVKLKGGDFLEKLSNTMKAPGLKEQSIKDLDATFIIESGKVNTSPFDVKIDAMSANVSGWVSFDEKIDYLMKMRIPREELGGDFNKMAEGLLGQANAFLGGNLSLGEYINMNVNIEGDLYNPSIKPAFAGMDNGESSVKEQATEAVKEVIEEEIKDLKEDLSKEADKLLADAQKQADKLIKEAEKAGDQLRKEADKQAQKLIDDAKNPLAKAGAKIAAEKINSEADKKANDLVKEAQKQADKIMADAQKRADELTSEK